MNKRMKNLCASLLFPLPVTLVISSHGFAYPSVAWPVSNDASEFVEGYAYVDSSYNNSMALGASAVIFAHDSVALGYQTYVGNGSDSGWNSAEAGTVPGSVALGYQSSASESGVISFGHKQGDHYYVKESSTVTVYEGAWVVHRNGTTIQFEQPGDPRTWTWVFNPYTGGWGYGKAWTYTLPGETKVYTYYNAYDPNDCPGDWDWQQEVVGSHEETIISNVHKTYEDDLFRRIVNVAPGSDDHDVVTVGQLKTYIGTSGGESNIEVVSGTNASVVSADTGGVRT